MGFAMIVLRVVTLGPALLTSLVLTVVVCALLPPTMGLVMFLAAGGFRSLDGLIHRPDGLHTDRSGDRRRRGNRVAR